MSLYWSIITADRAAILTMGTRAEMRAKYPHIIGAVSHHALGDATRQHLSDAKLAARLSPGFPSMPFG